MPLEGVQILYLARELAGVNMKRLRTDRNAKPYKPNMGHASHPVVLWTASRPRAHARGARAHQPAV